jgi:hypothetical protein
MGRIRKCKVCGQCSRDVNDLRICDGCSSKQILSNPVLAEHANAIRAASKRVISEVVDIGRRLAECKAVLKEERRWLAWIESEFRWSRNTAENLINVHVMVRDKCQSFDSLDVPVSSLYLLAGPSTPKAAIDEVIKRSEAGDKLSGQDVKGIIAGHKPTVVPMPPSAIDGVLGLIADAENGCYGKDDGPVIARVVQAASREQLEAIVGSTRFGGAYKTAATERLGAMQRAETRTIEYQAHDVPAREVTSIGYASDTDAPFNQPAHKLPRVTSDGPPEKVTSLRSTARPAATDDAKPIHSLPADPPEPPLALSGSIADARARNARVHADCIRDVLDRVRTAMNDLRGDPARAELYAQLRDELDSRWRPRRVH